MLPSTKQKLVPVLNRWAAGKIEAETATIHLVDLAKQFDVSQTDLIYFILEYGESGKDTNPYKI